LIASLLCIVGGVDNNLNLSSKSFITGMDKQKTFKLELKGEKIQNKSLLFKILNTALNSYNQTEFEGNDINYVKLSKDATSF